MSVKIFDRFVTCFHNSKRNDEKQNDEYIVYCRYKTRVDNPPQCNTRSLFSGLDDIFKPGRLKSGIRGPLYSRRQL